MYKQIQDRSLSFRLETHRIPAKNSCNYISNPSKISKDLN